MLKDVRLTFQKYSDPAWEFVRAFDRSYVPDEILEPVLTTLQNHASEILKYNDGLTLESLRAGKGRSWTWPETLALVQCVWNDLDPAYGARIAQSIENADFRYEDVDYGTGRGFCIEDFLIIGCDKSLNDPVCATHESGHLMARFMAPDKNDNAPADNIAEIQGMFIQEHAYTKMREQVRDHAEIESIRLHRLSYYVGILSEIPLYTHTLDQRSAAPCRSLIEEFSCWSVDPSIKVLLKAQPDLQSEEDDRHAAQRLHAHPFAVMVVPALYQRFQQKDDTARRQILSVLYEGGPQTTLTDVLAAFDVHTVEDVQALAEQTCHHFKTEISTCRLTHRPITTSLNDLMNSRF